MWLVIAALLLAAALQSIGYYQKAAFLNQLKSDLSGVGSLVLAESSVSGSLNKQTVTTAAGSANWSRGVTHTVEELTAGGKPFIRASVPGVPNSEGIYLFEGCGSMSAGVNIVPKSGTPDMDSCGITVSSNAGGSSSGGSVSFANLTFKTATPTGGNWSATASSADGKKLYAGSNYGKFYRSSDSGVTWTEGMSGATGRWMGAATTTDGTKVVLTVQNTGILISTDSGTTWTTSSAGAKAWTQVEMSSDGNVIAATANGDTVYLSTDGGASWTAQSALPAGYWKIGMSGDGKKILVGNAGANASVFITTNGGGTWTTAPLGSPLVTAAEISADGSVWVVKLTSSLQKSTDNGLTWKSFSTYGTNEISAMSLSADGSKMVISLWNSTDKFRIVTSTDAGVTWTNRSPVGGEATSVAGMATSSDGSKLLLGHSSTGQPLRLATYGP